LLQNEKPCAASQNGAAISSIMRTNTKLKKILEENTVGLSYSDVWEMTMINLRTRERRQFSGKTFSEMISRAYSSVGKSKDAAPAIRYKVVK